jgi:hypothetical protein
VRWAESPSSGSDGRIFEGDEERSEAPLEEGVEESGDGVNTGGGEGDRSEPSGRRGGGGWDENREEA